MRCKDGSWKWILDRGRIVRRGPDGAPLRMIGTHTDITGARRIEETLRKSEEMFRTVYAASPIGIELYDAAGTQIGPIRPRWRCSASPSSPKCSDSTSSRDQPERGAESQSASGESVSYHASFDFDR